MLITPRLLLAISLFGTVVAPMLGSPRARKIPNPADYFSRTEDVELVRVAMAQNRANEIPALVKAGGNPNALSKDGVPMLIWVFHADSIRGFEGLLDNGASIDPAIEHRNIPKRLYFYIIKNDKSGKYFRLLLTHGLEPNVGFRGEVAPLLTDAIVFHNEAVIRYLIESGADINRADRFQSTPLHTAVEQNLKAALLLIETGADPTLKDKLGRTAVDRLEAARARLVKWPKDSDPPPADWFKDYLAVVRAVVARHYDVPYRLARFAETGVVFP